MFCRMALGAGGQHSSSLAIWPMWALDPWEISRLVEANLILNIDAELSGKRAMAQPRGDIFMNCVGVPM